MWDKEGGVGVIAYFAPHLSRGPSFPPRASQAREGPFRRLSDESAVPAVGAFVERALLYCASLAASLVDDSETEDDAALLRAGRDGSGDAEGGELHGGADEERWLRFEQAHGDADTVARGSLPVRGELGGSGSGGTRWFTNSASLRQAVIWPVATPGASASTIVPSAVASTFLTAWVGCVGSTGKPC